MDIHEKSEAEKLDEIMLPGFRFHPTDEELVGFYLKRKVQQRPLSIELIRQLDIYKYDPWDLPKLATTGEKEWYFYCPRDRKYRNSARPNRVTGAGFWKATGTDRPIYSSDEPSKCIGLKKSLVFYKGRAAKGTKTDWMMHEFRLPSLTDNGSNSKRFIHKNIPPNDSWAICRIFKKANSNAQRALSHSWVSPVLPEKMSTELSSVNQYGIISNNIDLQQYSSSNITSFSPKYEAQPYYKMFLSPETYEQPKYTTLDASSVLMNMSSSSNLGDFGRALECLDYTTSGMQDHEYVQNAGFSICEGEEHRAYIDELHVDEQWGLNRSPLISSSSTAAAAAAAAAVFPFNLLCDSSPCPSDQLSTSLCTDHCYA